MAFEYTGLSSLRNPEIFQKILASAVEDTGLAYDFQVRGNLKNVDQAYDAFQYYAFHFLSHRQIKDTRAMLGLAALAIHTLSIFKLFGKDQVYFVDGKVVGLHAAAIRKNPNELVAITFGLSIIEIHADCARSPTGLLYSPSNIELGAITPVDIRHSIRIIAENRNKNLRTSNGQYWSTFWQLSRLIKKLRARRFQSRSKL